VGALAAFLAGLDAAADARLVAVAKGDGEAEGDADGDGEAGTVLTDTAGVGVPAAVVAKAAEDGPPEPELWDDLPPPLAIPENAQASRPITPRPAISVKNRRCQYASAPGGRPPLLPPALGSMDSVFSAGHRGARRHAGRQRL
jgi:hypothetical protein